MKISVSTYSFFSLMKQEGLSQLDCVKRAKELGFDGIEFCGLTPPEEMEPEEYARRLREKCEAENMAVTNFVFRADFLNGLDNSGERRKEVERVKKMVDIAGLIGAPRIRHDVLYSLGAYVSFDQALPLIADGIREVADYAREKGIRTMAENHGFICQDSLRMEKLFHAVNHTNFGLLCDMGNFLCVDEEPVQAVSLVAPYAAFVHAKDFYIRDGSRPDPGEGYFQTRGSNYLKGTIIGHGQVPVKQCLQILKKAGYQEGITIEYEGMEPVMEGLRISLANLRRYSEEAGL